MKADTICCSCMWQKVALQNLCMRTWLALDLFRGRIFKRSITTLEIHPPPFVELLSLLPMGIFFQEIPVHACIKLLPEWRNTWCYISIANSARSCTKFWALLTLCIKFGSFSPFSSSQQIRLHSTGNIRCTKRDICCDTIYLEPTST